MSIDEAKEVFNRLPAGIHAQELLTQAKRLRRVVLLKTMWYPEVLDALEQSAKDYFDEIGAGQSLTTWGVPGALELPLAAKWAFESGADLVVALGCIIRGQTPHFDFVSQSCMDSLIRVSLESSKALGVGVLTVNNSEEALKRLSKGFEAAQAATCMWVMGRKNA